MRFCNRLFFAFLTILATSCIQEQDQNITEDTQTLSISLGEAAQTRTWIDGTDNGAAVPLWWSDGDRINVNGIESSRLSLDGQKTGISEAKFKVINITAPYSILYPAEAYKGEENGRILVAVPTEQPHEENTFSNGSLLMAGRSDTETAELKPTCSVIKYTISDEESTVIRNVVLKSLTPDSHLAGKFAINPETGEMECLSNGSNIISLILPEDGITLTSAGRTFFFVIPAGEYPGGFEIKTTDAGQHAMRRYWLRSGAGAEAGVSVQAGRIYRFDNGEYVEDAQEICSAEDWQSFVAAYNAGEPWTRWLSRDGYVHIGGDFTVEASEQQFETFADKLNGNGHTITFTNAEYPLVKTLTGTIKDLRLAGKLTAADPAGQGAAAFCRVVSKGTLTGCTNAMEISVAEDKAADAVRAAGLVHSLRGGLVENCANNGNICIRTLLKDSNKIVSAGGIVGIIEQLASKAEIKGCINTGKITMTIDYTDVEVDNNKKNKNKPQQPGFGGIVGVINDGTEEKNVVISNCTNLGDVSVLNPNASIQGPDKSVSGVGGILGMNYRTDNGAFTSIINNGFNVTVTDCTNKGNIYNGCVTATTSGLLHKAYAGGLAGILFGSEAGHIKVSNCHNFGNVMTYNETSWGRPAVASVGGGFIGLCGWVDIDGSSVEGSIVGSDQRPGYAVNGCFGIAVRPFKITNCNIDVHLNQFRCNLSGRSMTEGNLSLTFCAPTKSKEGNLGGDPSYAIDFTGSVIEGNTFSGSVTTNEVLFNYDTPIGNYKPMTTTNLTSENYEDYILAKNTDNSAITLGGNTYGNEN